MSNGLGAARRPKIADRRACPRYQIPTTAGLIVAIGAPGFRPTDGVTFNISLGGLLARLSQKTFEGSEGTECLVRFLEVGDELKPHSMLGTIRRVEIRNGYFFVAVEFLEFLENLNLPGGPAKP